MADAIGAAAALLAVAPLLTLAPVALVPGWLASGSRGRAFYQLEVIMTSRDRERSRSPC